MCDPTIRQPVSTSLGNSGLCWTVFALRCLQKEMATDRHWSVSLWRDPDDVPHCRIDLTWNYLRWCKIVYRKTEQVCRWGCTCCSSLSVCVNWHGVSALDVENDSGCRIQEQHKSPYVTALLSQPVPSYGCVSREVVPTTQQQVDVLLLNVSSSWTTSSVNRQHMSMAWTTNGHHRQHIYLTLKQSVNYGTLAVVYLKNIHSDAIEVTSEFETRAVKQLISFLFHLQIDVVGPLLLNASLLLVLTTDYSDWLVQVTEVIDTDCYVSLQF